MLGAYVRIYNKIKINERFCVSKLNVRNSY